MPDATGSLVVARNGVTPCDGGLLGVVGDVVPAAVDGFPVPLFLLFVCVDGVTELLDEVVDVANGAIVDTGAVDEPDDGALLPMDRSGVVDPLAVAALGAVGDEPESNAKDEKSATMPKTDAAPIPLCSGLMFISRRNLKVYRPLQGRSDPNNS